MTTFTRLDPVIVRRVCLLALCAVLGVLTDASAQGAGVQRWRGIVRPLIDGGEDAPGAVDFTHVRGLAADGEGRTYVTDASQHALRVFDQSGRMIASVAQQGQGPGDLFRPCCVTLDEAGRIWVFEDGNRRWSAFDWKGGRVSFLRSVASPGGAGQFGVNTVMWERPGVLVHYQLKRDNRAPDGVVLRTTVRDDGTTLATDRLPFPPLSGRRTMNLTRRGPGGGSARTIVSEPYGPEPLFAFGAVGAWARASSDRYVVTVHRPAIGTTQTLRGSAPRVSVSARERELNQAYLDTLSSTYRQRIPFAVPKAKQPLAGLGMDVDGRVWVLLAAADGQLTRNADVYDSSGRLLARATWPSDVNIEDYWVIQGRSALAVQRDSDGVPSIVRVEFQIQR